MDGTQYSLEEQMASISEKLLRMGGMVEEAVGKSIRSLVERDSALAGEVIEGDAAVDRVELEIDDLCMEVLARHQPMAGDLRFITTAPRPCPFG